MRINVPVSGDGKAWMSHTPEIRFDERELVRADGRINEEKVIAMFREANAYHEREFGRLMFQFGSEDGHNVLSVAVEFLRQLTAVTRWLEESGETTAHTASDGSAQDRRLERRMNDGKVAFCRIDIRGVSGGVKILIGHGNPDNRIIGNCAGGAREFAIYVMRICKFMAGEINRKLRERNSAMSVTVVGRDPSIEEEADARNRAGAEHERVKELNARREKCPNRRGHYCSPIRPECECYRCGRCEAAVAREV